MATATTLAQAAGQAYDNLHIRWEANALKATLDTFWRTVIDQFPESEPNSHPVSNWFILISALADGMASTNVPIDQLTQAANYVYRLCWVGNFLQGSGLISNAQATFLLSSYNVIIGF